MWDLGVTNSHRKDLPDLEISSQVGADILSQKVWQDIEKSYGTWVNSSWHYLSWHHKTSSVPATTYTVAPSNHCDNQKVPHGNFHTHCETTNLDNSLAHFNLWF